MSNRNVLRRYGRGLLQQHIMELAWNDEVKSQEG